MPVLSVETTTTTTAVPRVVGDYPGELPVLGSAALLLALIVGAGAYMTRRSKKAEAARSTGVTAPVGRSADGRR